MTRSDPVTAVSGRMRWSGRCASWTRNEAPSDRATLCRATRAESRLSAGDPLGPEDLGLLRRKLLFGEDALRLQARELLQLRDLPVPVIGCRWRGLRILLLRVPLLRVTLLLLRPSCSLAARHAIGD